MSPINPNQEPDNIPIQNRLDFWRKPYEEDDLFWLVKHAHPFLSKNEFSTAIKTNTELSPKKIFVPLCGTTHDLSYLLSQGFIVFGIEFVKSCFDILNERDRLGLVYNEKDSTYETPDKRLVIFWGDFEKCPMEKFGPFDFIWDRASFCAIDQPLRPAYARMMNQALSDANDSTYFLELVSYNKSDLFSGPPRSFTERQLRFLFPLHHWNIRLVQRKKVNQDSPFFNKVPDQLEAEESIYMITRRMSM